MFHLINSVYTFAAFCHSVYSSVTTRNAWCMTSTTFTCVHFPAVSAQDDVPVYHYQKAHQGLPLVWQQQGCKGCNSWKQ